MPAGQDKLAGEKMTARMQPRWQSKSARLIELLDVR
jgi:hypothetical protein